MMQRGSENTSGGGGLGPQLVGEKLTVNRRNVSVIRQLGEGGFSFVYLVKDNSEDEHNNHNSSSSSSSKNNNNSNNNLAVNNNEHLVLKITSIHSRQQRDIAEKEANLLSKLSHPSIVRMLDSCYRNSSSNHPSNPLSSDNDNNNSNNHNNTRHQHLILMEYCEGGTALSVCNNLKNNNKQFDLHSLIIAFGQICNAVSYLHAQRPPIVHRDLKPVNFLVKNGAYKLCDFGSAVFGHVDLRTSRARTEAEEVIQKTTTQMFRSPEMVDLYMSKKLTQSTDVWALGCCLYSLAFLQNCFEEGSNLAILSRNFKIPDDNPYGKDLVELIDRMLTVNCRERADMTEVILCLSAIYSGRPLPPRKKGSKSESDGRHREKKEKREERVGTYRTDGQGIRKNVVEEKRPVEAKKLNPNSAAARRRKAAEEGAGVGSIPLTRQRSSLVGTLNTKKQSSQDSWDSSGFGEDPFRIGGEQPQKEQPHSPLSFFKFRDNGNGSSSRDWGGDFASENGSGFDTFASSDDGSRSTGFGTSLAVFQKTLGAPKEISDSVPPFAPDPVGFSPFGVSDDQNSFLHEEGFEATYDDAHDADVSSKILTKINEVGISDERQTNNRKSGLKKLFGKS